MRSPPVEEQVEVDSCAARTAALRARARAGARRRAAVEQVSGRKVRVDRRGAVQEPRLVGVADGVGLPQRGDRDQLDPGSTAICSTAARSIAPDRPGSRRARCRRGSRQEASRLGDTLHVAGEAAGAPGARRPCGEAPSTWGSAPPERGVGHRPEVERPDPGPAHSLERLRLVLEDRREHERAGAVRKLGEGERGLVRESARDSGGSARACARGGEVDHARDRRQRRPGRLPRVAEAHSCTRSSRSGGAVVGEPSDAACARVASHSTCSIPAHTRPRFESGMRPFVGAA